MTHSAVKIVRRELPADTNIIIYYIFDKFVGGSDIYYNMEMKRKRSQTGANSDESHTDRVTGIDRDNLKKVLGDDDFKATGDVFDSLKGEKIRAKRGQNEDDDGQNEGFHLMYYI